MCGDALLQLLVRRSGAAETGGGDGSRNKTDATVVDMMSTVGTGSTVLAVWREAQLVSLISCTGPVPPDSPLPPLRTRNWTKPAGPFGCTA